ncbi:MAG: FAD binding domain-containing protein [Methylocystaceae bacterium]
MALENVIKAQTLEQSLGLLAEQPDATMVIAGGTDLITKLREKRVTPQLLIDISDLPELNYITETNGEIQIGAATIFAEIARNPLIRQGAPGLQVAARGVGSPQIRNRGTIGGNICNGSPAADTVPPLLAMDATVVFQSREATREVALASIHLDKGQIDIRPGEILTQIKFKPLSSHQGLGYCKLGLRRALAISIISISIYVEVDMAQKCTSIRVASGSLGRFPQREYEVENIINGNPLTETVIQAATEFFGQQLQARLVGRPPVELHYKPEAIKSVFKTALTEAMSVAGIY